MRKYKLNQYKGPLDSKQISNGINAANDNAKRLLSDAELLRDNGRFASAIALTVLSIEESGKESVLRNLALSETDESIAASWKFYRSHKIKNAHWLIPPLIVMGVKGLDLSKRIYEANSAHRDYLDNLKQISLYTDCLDDAKWSSPTIEIREDLCKSIIRIAQLLLGARKISIEDIDIWIEHMRPVIGASEGEKKVAISGWYRALCRKGLIEDNEDRMEKFINTANA